MTQTRPFLTATALAAALAVVPVATAAMAQNDRAAASELGLFMEVFARVKALYVDRVDDKTLVKGAINGMLQALDPHSSFAEGIDYGNLRMMTDGSYGGLGLTVVGEDGAIKVISPQEDTPAWRAGVKAGDYITHIDGKLIVGMDTDEAIALMRGTPGTPVTLTIIRAGRDKPLELPMKRETIIQHAVKWEVKDGIGVLNINTFSATTLDETLAAMAAIEKQLGRKPTGYVVDLRDNGGGLLDQAIGVSDIFLTQGQVVAQRGRDPRDNQAWYAESIVKGDLAQGIPVVVLTNAGSASASEIVAGALQDHHRAIVMGERSFGKGSVQSVIEGGDDSGLPRGTALRLTTARYYTPSGRSVQEGGIDPDIRVPQLSDPDARSRLTIRESDLRRHLVAETKADNKLLETDTAADPRFAATPASLKAAGITDYQLDYAVKTLARTGPRTPAPRPVAASNRRSR